MESVIKMKIYKPNICEGKEYSISSVDIEISLGDIVTTLVRKTERYFTMREVDVIKGILKPDDYSFINDPKYYNKETHFPVASDVKKRIYKIDKILVNPSNLPSNKAEVSIYPGTNWKFHVNSLESFINLNADSVAFYILHDYAKYLESLPEKIADSFVKEFQSRQKNPKIQEFRKDLDLYTRGELQFALVELPERIQPYSGSHPSPHALEIDWHKPKIEIKNKRGDIDKEEILQIYLKRLEKDWGLGSW